MPAPSPLAIATGSVTRLLKEESSYYKEQEQQQKRIKSLEQNPGDDENAEFQMRQERRALEETKAVFPPLRQRIKDAAAKLEQQLTEIEEGTQVDEVAKASEVLEQVRARKE